MRAKDLQTLEIFLAEYGMDSGAPEYGQQTGPAKAKKAAEIGAKAASSVPGNKAAAANAAKAAVKGVQQDQEDDKQDATIAQLAQGDELEVDGEKVEVVSPEGEGDNPDVVVVQTSDGKQHELDPNLQLGESVRKLISLAGRARTDESKAQVRALVERYLMPKPTAVDRFLNKPLSEQLIAVEALDPPRVKRNLSEGAVPNNDAARALNKLMNEHFPVGDYGKQMEAYIALPVPSMLRDFWALEANEGHDACARWIVREYIKKFAPDTIRGEIKLNESRQGSLRAIVVTERIHSKVGKVRDASKEKTLVQAFLYDPEAKKYAETEVWARGKSSNADSLIERVKKQVVKKFGVEPEMGAGTSVFMRKMRREGYYEDESLLSAPINESRQALNEYEDLEQARREILDRLKDMDLADENPEVASQNKKILDQIYTVLNKNNVMGRIGKVLPSVLKGEYPEKKILEIAGEMMKAPLSYKDREKFISNLAKDRVINHKLLLQGGQYSINKLVFNDEVNLIMFDHLKGFGVGQQMKGPAEHALAILSTKISIQGKGDVDVDGTPVEIKASVGSKKGAGGGRFGEAGHLPTRENILKLISKYEQVDLVVQAALQRQKGINIETFTSLVNKSGIEPAERKQFANELFGAIFGSEASRVIQEFSKPNADPNAVRVAYIKSNFDWYKNSDQGGEWEVLSTISFPDAVVATIKTADDLDKLDIYKKNPSIVTTGKPQEMLFQFNPKSVQQ